jgi:alpha-L-rhamnosidase
MRAVCCSTGSDHNLSPKEKTMRMFRQGSYPALILIALGALSWASASPADPPDTRGPVQNTDMTVKVDRHGVQAPGYHWQKPEPKGEWSANWISSTDRAERDSAGTCLRREVTLDQQPKKVTAWISGDNYLLYVNGVPAGRGSADPGKDYQGFPSGRRFYETRDLTPLFHRGNNAVSVELAGSNRLILELLVEFPDGKKVTLGTDANWRGVSSRYLLNRVPPEDDLKMLGAKPRPLPLFDASAEPQGWLQPGYDDSQWPPCRVTEAPKELLVMSELPPLMEARYPYFEITNVQGGVTVPKEPLTPGHPIIVRGEGQFSVHFDKIMAGRCGIKVKGVAGARLLLLSNETGDIKGSRVYQILLRDGVQTFESRDYYALGTVTVAVRNASSPVEIQEVSADFLSQPVEYGGSFSCSDEELNRLYESGRWSTQICMISHHLDSPQHQEPISDYGDYLIADLVNYYTMGNNPWLARQDLRKWAWVMEAAKYRTFHTSYIFYWLQSLLNYYDHTGDRSMIDELAPNVHAVIDQFASYIGKNGIISEAPNYMFMDWVTIPDAKDGKKAFGAHHPPAVIGQGYMTALFYRGLEDAIRICKLQGDTERSNKYDAMRKKLAAAYQTELWNASRGQYRDGKPFVTSVKPSAWLPADVDMESFSAQNNSFSVLYGLTPRERRPDVMDRVVEDKLMFPRVTPYFMHFVFDAFAAAGRFDQYAVAGLKSYKICPGTQTVREMGPDRGDYSHGWIATPAYQMPSKILGVQPASPGFKEILIKPHLCGLSWAKGTVPTPHGPVSVSWTSEKGGVRLEVTLPEGTTGMLSLPTTGTNPSLNLDGKSISGNFGINGDRSNIPIGPGHHACIISP